MSSAPDPYDVKFLFFLMPIPFRRWRPVTVFRYTRFTGADLTTNKPVTDDQKDCNRPELDGQEVWDLPNREESKVCNGPECDNQKSVTALIITINKSGTDLNVTVNKSVTYHTHEYQKVRN